MFGGQPFASKVDQKSGLLSFCLSGRLTTGQETSNAG